MIQNSKCLLCLLKSGLATNKVLNTRVQTISVTCESILLGLARERYGKKRETKSSAGAVFFTLFYVQLHD